jgi:drug/metabolite transporter (DMT)-like permease
MGAVVSFSVLALSARALGGHLSVFQILFLRSAVGLPLLVASVFATGGVAALGALRTRKLGLHVGRNTIHVVGQLAWFYGVTVLPLATVFAMEYSSPLWAVLLAALFISEFPTRAQTGGLLLGLVGILVIVRPGAEGLDWAAMIVLGAAVFFAAANLYTRVLGRSEQAIGIPFWMFVVQLPLGLLLALADWRPIALADLPAILLLGLTGLTAHHSLSAALRLAPISQVIHYDYLRLPLIAVVGALFYGEPLDPYVLGGGGIVLGGVFLARSGSRAAAPAVSAAKALD